MKDKNSFALGALVGSVVTAIGFGIGLGVHSKKKEFDDLSVRFDDPTDFDFSVLDDENGSGDIYINPEQLKNHAEDKLAETQVKVGKKLNDAEKKAKSKKKKADKKVKDVKKEAKKETKKVKKDVKDTAKTTKKAVENVVDEIKE